MGLQSLDQINVGDWLVCEAGPKILVRTPFSEDPEYRRDKEMEGLLAKVIAVNPPLFLLKIYTMGSKRIIYSPMNFNDALWTRANENYKKQYLDARKERLNSPEGETL